MELVACAELRNLIINGFVTTCWDVVSGRPRGRKARASPRLLLRMPRLPTQLVLRVPEEVEDKLREKIKSKDMTDVELLRSNDCLEGALKGALGFR